MTDRILDEETKAYISKKIDEIVHEERITAQIRHELEEFAWYRLERVIKEALEDALAKVLEDVFGACIEELRKDKDKARVIFENIARKVIAEKLLQDENLREILEDMKWDLDKIVQTVVLAYGRDKIIEKIENMQINERTLADVIRGIVDERVRLLEGTLADLQARVRRLEER